MSCINFSLNNFACSQKTDPWQFLMNEKERPFFFFFQWVIYRKFYFEDFGKNVERCVT